ncbi:hypothetical protein D3C81_1956080 [compost metagenome]
MDLHGIFIHKAAAVKRSLEIRVQHHIFPQGKIQHQTVLVPVLRDKGQPRFADMTGRAVLHLHTLQQNPAGIHLAQACQGRNQLALAVAVHAGYTQNLSRIHLQGNTVQCTDTTVILQ